MAKQFDPRKVLRLTSNNLLRELFATRGDPLDVPWDTLKESQVEPIHVAMQGLSPQRLTEVETILRDVQELADERGMIALAEELRVMPQVKVAAFAELHSRHDKALWVRLNEPAAFMRTALFARADALSTGRQWVQRNGLPTIEVKVDDATKWAFGAALSRYYTTAQGRGCHAAVEPYTRAGGALYFFSYIEGFPDAHLSFDVTEGMVRRFERRAFENCFVYDPKAGTLDVYVQGGKKVREPLQECFSTAVLGVSLPPEDRTRPPYQLDHLLDPAMPFPTDPADGIARVRVRRLRLEPVNRPRRRMTLEADPNGTPDDIQRMIDEYLRIEAVPRTKLRVTQATFALEFIPGAATQPKSMTFEVSCPNSCNLKSKTGAMAGLIGRVKMLERAAGVRGECARCGDRGTPGFEVWIDGERTRPEGRWCATCGRRGVVTRLIIDGPDGGDGDDIAAALIFSVGSAAS